MAFRISLIIDGTSKDAEKALKDTERGVDGVTRANKRAAAGHREVATATAASGENFEKLARAASVAGGPLGAMIAATGALTVGSQKMNVGIVATTVAIGAGTAVLYGAVRAYAALEAQQARTANALRATGGVSGQSIASLNAATGRLAAPGTHDLEDIRAAQAELIRFRDISGEAFERTLKTAQNLSNTFGGTLVDSTKALARALVNPIEGMDALREAGARITPVQQKIAEDLFRSGRAADSQKYLFDLLASQMGGATTQSADTLSAAFGRLKSASTDLFEHWGEQAAKGGGVKGMLDYATGIIERLAKVKPVEVKVPDIVTPPPWLKKLLDGNVEIKIPDPPPWLKKLLDGLGGALSPFPAAPAAAASGALPPLPPASSGALSQVAAWNEYFGRGGSFRSVLGDGRVRPEGMAAVWPPGPPTSSSSIATGAIPLPRERPVTTEQEKLFQATNIELEKQAKLWGLNETARAQYEARARAGIATDKAETEAMRAAAGAIDARVNAMMAAQFMRGFTDQTAMQTASLKIEADTMFMAAGAAAAYKLEKEKLNEASIKGTILSDADIAQIKGQATAFGEATQSLTNLRDLQGSVSGMGAEFRQQLQQGATAWTALGNAGVSALGRLSDKLLDRAFNQALGSVFGLFNVGGGGFAPGITPPLLPTSNLGFGGPTAGVNFAYGGYTGPGGKYEPAGVVHRGEYVFDSDSVRRIGLGNLSRLRGYAGGGHVMPPPTVPGMSSSSSQWMAPVTLKTELIFEDHVGVHAEQREEPDGRGGRRARVVIKELVAGTFTPGSPATAAVLGAVGTRQRPRRHG